MDRTCHVFRSGSPGGTLCHVMPVIASLGFVERLDGVSIRMPSVAMQQCTVANLPIETLSFPRSSGVFALRWKSNHSALGCFDCYDNDISAPPPIFSGVGAPGGTFRPPLPFFDRCGRTV